MARPQGITKKDVKELTLIYEQAQEDIQEVLKNAGDLTFSEKRRKEALLASVQEILLNLYNPTVEFILDQTEVEFNEGLENVDQALEGLETGQTFTGQDLRVVTATLGTLQEIQEGGLKDVREALSDTFNSIQKSFNLIEKAKSGVVNDIIQGNISGASKNEIKKNILQTLKREGVFSQSDFNKIQENKNLAKVLAMKRGENRNLLAENITDKKAKEALEKLIQKNNILIKTWEETIFKNGTVGFTYKDKKGKDRNISLEAYVEATVRQNLIYANANAVATRSLERGNDTLRVSTHSNPSPMCEPYQGVVVSITGKNKDYPSMKSVVFAGDWKKGGGVFHRHCRHSFTVFVDTNIEFNE